MSFVKKLLPGALFGVPGVLAQIASGGKKKDKPSKPSLATGDYNSSSGTSGSNPSMINDRSIY